MNLKEAAENHQSLKPKNISEMELIPVNMTVCEESGINSDGEELYDFDDLSDEICDNCRNSMFN